MFLSTSGNPTIILQPYISPLGSYPHVSPLPHYLQCWEQDGTLCSSPGGSPLQRSGLKVWPGVLKAYLINGSGNAPWLQHELQDPQIPEAASPQSPGRQAPHQAVPAVEQILKAKEHGSHASSLQ